MTDTTGTALATATPQPRAVRQYERVEDLIPILDTDRFEHMQRIATIMANSSLIPDALRKAGDEWLPLQNVVSNCFLVVNQAVRWGMDPFAVAQCASVVHGRLMYEGKLVAAALEKQLKTRLSYEFGLWNPTTETVDLNKEGTGDNLGVIVSGTLPGDTEAVKIEGSVGIWKTTGNNSPWRPGAFKRQLRYRGAREWARAHSAGVMLGIITDDELGELEERRERTATRGSRSRTLTAGFGDAAPALAAPSEARQAEETKPTDDATTTEKATPEAETAAETVSGATIQTDPATKTAEGATVGEDEGDAAAKAEAARAEKAHEDHLDLIFGEGVEAAKEGGPREAPDDLDDEEAEVWLNGFDEERKLEEEERKADSAGKSEQSSTESGAGTSEDESDFPGDKKPASKEKAPEEVARETKAVRANGFTEINAKIIGQTSWTDVKSVISSFATTQDYADGTPTEKAMLRSWAWDRFVALRDAGTETVEVTTDLTLFRFWLEFAAESVSQIDALFRAFFKSEAYKAADENSKRMIGDLVKAAKERIAAAASS